MSITRPGHADFCNREHLLIELPCSRIAFAPEGTTSPETLHRLAPGTRVADAMHDLWTKQPDGMWAMDQETILSAEHLLHVWGPVTLIPKGGL